MARDIVSDVMKWEEAGMNLKEEARFFQKLVDSGQAWKLQGMYGRRAMELIETGVIMLGKQSHRDYYGNYIPSRYEVKNGTKGSPAYVRKMRNKLRKVL